MSDDEWVKHWADELWFEFDFSDQDETPWLPPGVTITSFSVTVDVPLVKLDELQQGSSVFVKVAGGVVLQRSVVACGISTSDGNVYNVEKSIYVIRRAA